MTRPRIKEERGSALSMWAEFLGIVTALITLWEFGARLDIIPGRSPVQRAQEAIEDIANGENSPVPTPTNSLVDGQETTQPLEVPTNVRVSGGCDGFTFTWDPVEGAERYVIEKDGSFAGFETGTEHQFFLLPDGRSHEYRLIAHAFGTESDPSVGVLVGPCSP